jgi:calcineurin-like phosphoesterase
MKQIIFTLTFIISISINGIAQSNVDVNEMVGFGCYEDGSQSKPVQKVSKLIDKEKYNSIIKLLDSENNAEKYLAVVVCEKLTELNKLTLTKELKEKIAEIYKSNGIVSVCSGCVYWDKLTLKKMLDKENDMRISASYWLDYKFKKE